MESYRKIFYCPEDRRLGPGESFSFDFDADPRPDEAYRFFFTGEVESFYYWKSEYCCTTVYKKISDSLVPGEKDAFALEFDGADYPVVCFKKLPFPPVLGYLGLKEYADVWNAGIRVRGEDISVAPGGYLRLTVELRSKKEGRLDTDVSSAPDAVYTVDVPEGTYPSAELSVPIDIASADPCNILFIVEGENFGGKAFFETPFMTDPLSGYNIVPPFAPDSGAYASLFNWFGVNLSKTEWPKMKIALNGETVFDGEFFERCHRYSEKEFSFDGALLRKGSNTLSFTLTSDGHDPLPYRIREVGLVSEPCHAFDLISYPEIVTAGKPFGVLIQVNEPVTLGCVASLRVLTPLTFDKPGLYGVRMVADGEAVGVPVHLGCDGHTESFFISRVIRREEDGVITGTGDLIYINQNPEDFKNYIKWYCSNRIGELMTVRPTYRWSGTRKYDLSLWEDFMRVLDSMGMKYPHMLDGREPNGYCAQPSLEEFSRGEGFLGRQLHERDGAYSYWGSYRNTGDFWNVNKVYDTQLFFDILHRLRRLDPAHAGSEFYPEDFFNDGKTYWMCHDPSLPADAKVRADAVMASLRSIAKGATRHTGPSILFKYFAMAGYTWLGAETMDSPTEFLMAALRGAAEAYGIKRVGVHHALQWSSSPHEDPMRYRRYRLALYVSWMQGAHENNTEEGLWHMEEFYESHNRHGVAAKAHLAMQQDFNRYIQSHSRRGVLHAPVAMLHGRYDGAACFGGASPWGALKEEFSNKFDAEESWFIPRLLFHPNANRKGWSAAKHGCKTGPIGLVSGNPLGNFDTVPVEKPWRHRELLAFMGYNMATPEDLDRILSEVRAGSALLLTAAHLSDTTLRADTQAYRLSFFEHPIHRLLGFNGIPTFEDDTLGGKAVKVGAAAPENARIIKTSDSGRPLAYEVPCGQGSVVFFNVLLYPAADPVRDLYSDTLRELTERVREKERVLPVVDSTVQATAYDLDDGSGEIYYIAVDWWNDPEPERKASLRIGDRSYQISLPFGVMKKVKVKGDIAVVCERESGDVLTLDGTLATLQGEGEERFILFRDGEAIPFTEDFSETPAKTVDLGSVSRQNR